MKEAELGSKGVVLCVSGPSGVGKGTVIAALQRLVRQNNQHQQIDHSVSVTTREPRPGETEGVDYYFRNREAFEQLLREGEILEHDEYCGNYYGTPRAPILDRMNQGIDVVMDVTVPGSLETIRNFPAAIGIFLLPPSFTELRRRLEGRGTEKPEAIELRMAKAVTEIKQASRFKYIVVNYDVAETARQILAILEAERHLAVNMQGIEELIINR
ncbi:MAG: guanylate kinase [Oscillospiraceae bacterium]|nr:guanylate kinase [Oscillospiraceae bacterium]MDD4368321.1 guanylate kinase [Oscillospiraceae bacterium]